MKLECYGFGDKGVGGQSMKATGRRPRVKTRNFSRLIREKYLGK